MENTPPVEGNSEERQLSPDEIIELKERFRTDYNIGPEVCVHIVINNLLENEERHERQKAEAEARGGTVISNINYKTREDFAWHVGVLSASWSRGLAQVIELPGSEWPEYMASPTIYAKALKEVEAQKAEANDPEAPDQPSSSDIAELKRKLAGDPDMVELICSRLAIEAVEVLNGIDLKKSFSYGLVTDVGSTAIRYSRDVQSALNMDDDEWPEDASISPERLSQEVEAYVGGDQNG